MVWGTYHYLLCKAELRGALTLTSEARGSANRRLVQAKTRPRGPHTHAARFRWTVFASIVVAMLDVEDFDAVFQGITYSDGIVQEILEYQHALGQTFFERLLEVLKITGTPLPHSIHR